MTTEAGRALLEGFRRDGTSEHGMRGLSGYIAAIEAEAAAAEYSRALTAEWAQRLISDAREQARAALLAELEAAITAMPVCVSTGDDLFDNLPLEDWNKSLFLMLDRAAVLDLIRKAGTQQKVECWCPVESPEQPGVSVNPHCLQHGAELPPTLPSGRLRGWKGADR